MTLPSPVVNDPAAQKNFEALERAVSPLVTGLPSNPIDGQEVYYLADAGGAAGGPFLWHLRYRAAATSTYKWEPAGAPPALRRYVGTYENRGVDGFGDLATVGPQITVPLAGDYTIEIACWLRNSIAAGGAWMSYGFPASAAGFDDRAIGQDAFHANSVWRSKQGVNWHTLAAGDTVTAKYARATASGFAEFRYRKMLVTPVRVG